MLSIGGRVDATSRTRLQDPESARRLRAVGCPRQTTRQIFSMLVPPGAPIGSPQVMA